MCSVLIALVNSIRPQAPFCRPLRNPFGVGGKGTGGRGAMGAGEGIGKVVGIRGGELWGLLVGGGVEIEEDR